MRRMSALAVLMLCGQLGNLRAEIKCTTSDYHGTYAFYAIGSLLKLPPEAAILQGPFAQAGTFTTDGDGNLTIESIPSYNGIVIPANSVANYTITPDCILTVSLVLPEPLSVPSTFTGVLSSDNRQLNLMITDPPGTVVSGEHSKQDVKFCGGEDFSGSYQVDLGGSVSAPQNQAGPFHRIGRLLSDGEGHFSAETIADYAGLIVPEKFDGTYQLNARCLLTLKYTYNHQEITLTGPLAGHGEAFYLVVTTPGWAVAGALRAQQ